jgi:hypothetical protein
MCCNISISLSTFHRIKTYFKFPYLEDDIHFYSKKEEDDIHYTGSTK